VGRLVPLLLDRGDPIARLFGLQLAGASRTPEVLEALRQFALGQRGPDVLRIEAAGILVDAGVLPPTPLRLWQQGKLQEAMPLRFELFDHPEGHPHTARVEKWASEAMAALLAEDAERAAGLLQKALAEEPQARDLQLNLSEAYRLAGRDAEADDLVRRIHEQHPDYYFGRTNLSRIYSRQKDLVRARQLLEPLLSQRRLHVTALDALCAAFIELELAEGNRDLARAWVDLLARYRPDSPNVAGLRYLVRPSLWRRVLGR
jgi:tetratricopeptide (TPR) repeat protein